MTTTPAKKSFPWTMAILLAVFVGLPVLACACSVLAGAAMFRGDSFSLAGATGDAVAVIFAEGTITSGSAAAINTTGVTPRRIQADLKRAAADPTVKAVVVHVNSPGGSVVASNEIHKLLKDFAKPVVFYFGETAASGGYYIACAGKWIVANPDTLTGSIGVITEIPNTDELLKKIGVQFIVIKSGANKDIGNPFRAMTDDEKKLFQAIIDEAYAGFVKIVADGRNLPEDKVRPIADGRVYTGRQAKELGLVDQLGYLDDAVSKAGELGGIQGRPRVVEYLPRLSFAEILLNSFTRAPALSLEQLVGLEATPRLEYRFTLP